MVLVLLRGLPWLIGGFGLAVVAAYVFVDHLLNNGGA